MSEQLLQVVGLFVANASLILWFRSESRNDWRHMDNKLETYSQELKALHVAMLEESKDFHARLISLEERNKK